MDLERAEREIQIFDFSVEQIKLEHRLLIKKSITKLIKEFVGKLINRINISPHTAEALEKKQKLVVEQIFGLLEDQLQKFDTLLENHFGVPDNVLLNAGREKYSEGDELYYQEKVEDVEKTFKQTASMLYSLNQEMEYYEKLGPIIEAQNELMKKIEDSFNQKSNLDYSMRLVNITEDIKSKDDPL